MFWAANNLFISCLTSCLNGIHVGLTLVANALSVKNDTCVEKMPVSPDSIGSVKSYGHRADKDSRKERSKVTPLARAVPAESLPRTPHPLGCRSTYHGIDGDRRDAVERWCDNCEHPSSSLLRVVLIAEIIRAEEEDLLAIADVFDEMGLLQLDDDDDDPPSDDQSPKASLRRIK